MDSGCAGEISRVEAGVSAMVYIAAMVSFFLFLVFLMPGNTSDPPHALQAFQPKPILRDTTGLLSHRWLVTSTEKAGKKSGANAGSMQLYMNFFSNGGFDFVGIGDGDMLIWKFEEGSVKIFRKSGGGSAPEAVYRIKKINAGNMIISGIQAGTAVSYSLTHLKSE